MLKLKATSAVDESLAYMRQGQEESFHVLVAPEAKDSASRQDTCKMLMSGMLLKWPAPQATGRPLEETGKPAEITKIESIVEFLEDIKASRGHDLVLVAHSARFWFQLPPEVFVQRYLKMVTKLGVEVIHSDSHQSRWRYTVVIAAHHDSHLATGISPELVVGTVSDMREMYQSVLQRLQGDPSIETVSGAVGVIYREQQESSRISKHAGNPWWQAHMAGLPGMRWAPSWKRVDTKLHQGNIIRNATFVPAFGITVDADGEILGGITSNGTYSIANISDKLYYHHNSDLTSARKPFSENNTSNPLSAAASTLVPLHTTLDSLPWTELSWDEVDLISPKSPHISPILDASKLTNELVSSVWAQSWFQANARALLRRAVVQPQPFIHVPQAQSSSIYAQRYWDHRGGRGGVWQGRRWLGWKTLCKGQEDHIFGDGFGPWGGEEGAGRKVFNSLGTVVTEEKV